MKRPVLTFLVLAFVLSIAIFQIFIIYKIYLLEKNSLKEKLNVILDLTYKKDLDDRLRPEKAQKSQPVEYSIESVEDVESEPKDVTHYNIDSMNINEEDIISLIQISMSEYANKKSPMDIHVLAEIASNFMKEQNIHTDFAVQVVDSNHLVLQTTFPDITENSFFTIASKEVPLNFHQTERLRILLVNPQKTIFKQISLVIFSCLLFSLFCVYCIWWLQHIFSRQRKITDIKNDMFSHTSHELKRPIVQIVMAVDSLQEPKIIQDESRRNKYLEIIRDAGDNASRKINMILALSMEEEGVFQLIYSEFDLLELVRELIQDYQLSTKKTVEITLNSTSEKTIIKADKDHITQCLLNLLENAVKYSGNPVTIQVSLFDDNSYLVISVKDNGFGIPESNLNSIFDKYSRIESNKDKNPGFGIGLHYVKRILEKHTGKVEVRSVLGEGSEFLLYLPK